MFGKTEYNIEMCICNYERWFNEEATSIPNLTDMKKEFLAERCINPSEVALRLQKLTHYFLMLL
jgi:hypothetical protein